MTKLPNYVRMEGWSFVLRLDRKHSIWFDSYKPEQNPLRYYCDNGGWTLCYEWRDDKLFSKTGHDHLNGFELIPATHAEWKKAVGEYGVEKRVVTKTKRVWKEPAKQDM